MTRRRKSGLSPQDRALWARVAATAEPLHGARPPVPDQPDREALRRMLDGSALPEPAGDREKPAPYKPVYTVTPVPLAAADRAPAAPAPIAQRLLRKLARGRADVDARIDLHGMTQDRARVALLDFLEQMQGEGAGLVLVITGKGERGTGVLRRNVPRWLNSGPFRAIVSGIREATGAHGGAGALYVRLKKRRGPVR